MEIHFSIEKCWKCFVVIKLNWKKNPKPESNIWSWMCPLGHYIKRCKYKNWISLPGLWAHCAGRKSRESGPSRRRLGDATLSLLLWVWLTGNMSVWWERTGMQLLPREYLHPGHIWAPLNPEAFLRLPPPLTRMMCWASFHLEIRLKRRGTRWMLWQPVQSRLAPPYCVWFNQRHLDETAGTTRSVVAMEPTVSRLKPRL